MLIQLTALLKVWIIWPSSISSIIFYIFRRYSIYIPSHSKWFYHRVHPSSWNKAITGAARTMRRRAGRKRLRLYFYLFPRELQPFYLIPPIFYSCTPITSCSPRKGHAALASFSCKLVMLYIFAKKQLSLSMSILTDAGQHSKEYMSKRAWRLCKL